MRGLIATVVDVTKERIADHERSREVFQAGLSGVDHSFLHSYKHLSEENRYKV